jgi:hypothetical protein
LPSRGANRVLAALPSLERRIVGLRGRYLGN